MNEKKIKKFYCCGIKQEGIMFTQFVAEWGLVSFSRSRFHLPPSFCRRISARYGYLALFISLNLLIRNYQQNPNKDNKIKGQKWT